MRKGVKINKKSTKWGCQGPVNHPFRTHLKTDNVCVKRCTLGILYATCPFSHMRRRLLKHENCVFCD